MIIQNNYIIAIEKNDEQYNKILSLIHNRPMAQDGFTYKMKANTLEWELVELPPIIEDDEAVEADYIDALNTLGVNTNEEN